MLTKQRSLIVLLIVLLLTGLMVQPAHAEDSLRVFYSGADGSVKTALELARFNLITDAAQADVFVLNGEIPDEDALRARLDQGAGLVLFLGPNLNEQQVSAVKASGPITGRST